MRGRTVLLAGGAALLATAALAQTAPVTAPPASTPPSSNTVGPQELQNFSLPGTAVRPAEPQPSTSAPAKSTSQPPAAQAPSPARAVREAARRPAPQVNPSAPERKPLSTALAPPPTAPSPTPTETQAVTAPPAQVSLVPPTAPAALPQALAPQPEHRLPMLPWLLAALAIAAATGFFLWRRRPRQAVAGPMFDLLVAAEPQPEPAPAPRPAPDPRPATGQQPDPAPVPRGIVSTRLSGLIEPEPPAPRGIVATRLRPTVEIGVRPLRCLVEESQVTIEFELELFNSGTAPARAVLAEASLLNAGATQDQELAAFFAKPTAGGGGLDAIPPMKRLTMTSQVVAPRSAIQEYELGGRKAFVPVLAFNTLYEWSGGRGQTSSAYLVGRETDGDKLGPLRLDSGARDYRGLGARLLPTGVRL